MRKGLGLSRRREWKGWIFAAPFAAGMLFLFFVPLCQSLLFSFGQVHMAEGASIYSFEWGGVTNYARALTEELDFTKGLLMSVGEMAASVPVIVVVSFLIAILIKSKFPGRGLYRLLFFLPVILTAGILPTIDKADILQGLIGSGTVVDWGAQNDAANLINTAWLTDALMGMNVGTGLVKYLVDAIKNIIHIVNSSGIQILIFLAALQTVSPSIYEAARVEGATGWETFWKVTVPMISPQILVVAVYTVIDSFVNVNNTLIQTIYKIGFVNFNIGYAAAMSWLYFAVIAVIIGVVYAGISHFVFYDDREG